MRKVRQIFFVAPAPMVWARHLGLFEQEGLDVEATQTISSDQIGQGLADGQWDIGIGVVDNVLAWNADRNAGLRILAQLERSQPMAFCVAPQCRSLVEAAKGVIAVDATDNGFVLVLYRALAGAGIERASCRFEKVGGVRQRFEALAAGRVTGTVLVPPFIDMALGKGCVRLWSGEELAPAYPGVVVAARAEWVGSNRPAVLAYLRALCRANAWATAGKNRDAAAVALQDAGYSEPAAIRLIDNAVPNLEPSRAGWNETIRLRQDAGLLAEAPPEFDAIVDVDLLRGAAFGFDK
jgi:ABC-type nitrate/sulfonate/bicarbonate transport system substrate-binding protein